MLKHRNIVILFLLLLAGLVIGDCYYTISWIVYLFLICAFLGIEIYGAYFIHSNFHLKAICNINTSEKVIALTFDDGPALQTEKVLDVLKEFNTTATFFVIGNRIKGNETILKKIDEAGHIVGNHSYSHDFFFDLKDTGTLINDLELANREIKKTIGKEPAFFRPPYGVTTPGLARAVSKLNFEVIGWNIRSLDTSIKDKQQVLNRIKERVKPGSVLLMHDTISGIEIVLKEVLIWLKENNYKVVALDSLIQKKAYV